MPVRHPHPALDAVWGYLAEVTGALGVGLESCTVDHDVPVSAYVALDERLPGHPDRDVALLWDEIHGWAAAIETHSGEDLIVLRYLGGKTVVPPPAQVSKFVKALREDDHRLGQLTPPSLRTASGLADLRAVLGRRTRSALREIA
ncbi:DUF6292 family protein [Amycolatopsis regifaucium]|nr:DUF6292 family protein [Amycolatopsis regifaucium]SFH30058.1 hypothetical protein SAMN04489731_103421 [Amycolatopsis regifaucium]